jgi:hypothetical protein
MDSFLPARAEKARRRVFRKPSPPRPSPVQGRGVLVGGELERSDSQRLAATRSGPGPDLARRRGRRSLVIFPVFYSIAPGATARGRVRASRRRLGVLSERKSFCSAFRHGELPTRPGQRVTIPSCTADARDQPCNLARSCTADARSERLATPRSRPLQVTGSAGVWS